MKKYVFLAGALVLLLALLASGALASAAQPVVRPVAQAAGTLEGPRWVLVSYTAENGQTAAAVSGSPAVIRMPTGGM